MKIQVAAREEERLDSVLRLAARSWPLFPIVERGKTPLISQWSTRASCVSDVIRGWAYKHPGCNWGVPCGSVSGFWVLDVDGDPGLARLVDWEKQGYCLSRTLTSRTGRGVQFFYEYPADGSEVRNSAGKLAPNLDTRGIGGYVVVPGSTHPNGKKYEFVDETAPIAEAPPWLLEMVANQAKRPTIAASEIGILYEGRRNDGLVRLGGAMRRKGATEVELQAALSEANLRRCRPPLDEREVRRIAMSVVRYPVGGPDPLETAWQAMNGTAYTSQFEKFVALCQNLQVARPEYSIALPLQRIGGLMGCDWTQVRRWRRRAVNQELLRPDPDGHYIPHRKSGRYFFTENDSQEKKPSVPLGEHLAVPLGSVPLRSPNSGLVGQSGESLVGQSQVSKRDDIVEDFAIRRQGEGIASQVTLICEIHGMMTPWRRRGQDWLCSRCHPRATNVVVN